jgi:hypothetical protein
MESRRMTEQADGRERCGAWPNFHTIQVIFTKARKRRSSIEPTCVLFACGCAGDGR